MCRSRLAMAAAVLVLLPSSASADFIYTISYSAVTHQVGATVFSFPADSFSFSVPEILTSSASQKVTVPGAELNGFEFDSLQTYSVFGPRDFEIGANFDGARLGDVVALFFRTGGLPLAPGLYPSSEAGRAIFDFVDDAQGLRSATFVYVPGTLEISATTAIPEPASILLLATGILGIGRWRKRR